MNPEAYITYVVATILVLVVPGPTILLVIGQAMTHGRRSVIPLVAGVVAGDLTCMTCSLLGLGAVLMTSSLLFAVFKWIGAIYLVYLGIRMWRTDAGVRHDPREVAGASFSVLFRRSFIVTALNPKGIAFFIAFLPQFINPVQPVRTQLFLLGTTFLLLALVNASLYAIFAGQLRNQIRRERVRKLFNRCGGGAMIGAGVVTAGMQHSS